MLFVVLVFTRRTFDETNRCLDVTWTSWCSISSLSYSLVSPSNCFFMMSASDWELFKAGGEPRTRFPLFLAILACLSAAVTSFILVKQAWSQNKRAQTFFGCLQCLCNLLQFPPQQLHALCWCLFTRPVHQNLKHTGQHKANVDDRHMTLSYQGFEITLHTFIETPKSPVLAARCPPCTSWRPG